MLFIMVVLIKACFYLLCAIASQCGRRVALGDSDCTRCNTGRCRRFTRVASTGAPRNAACYTGAIAGCVMYVSCVPDPLTPSRLLWPDK
jgi:hypothetical protein